jgi:hypothetical protein
MGPRKSLWSRWKSFAQKAAEVQANVLFFLLYYVAIVPMGLLRLGRGQSIDRPDGTPSWTRHESSTTNIDSARRQF